MFTHHLARTSLSITLIMALLFGPLLANAQTSDPSGPSEAERQQIQRTLRQATNLIMRLTNGNPGGPWTAEEMEAAGTPDYVFAQGSEGFPEGQIPVAMYQADNDLDRFLIGYITMREFQLTGITLFMAHEWRHRWQRFHWDNYLESSADPTFQLRRELDAHSYAMKFGRALAQAVLRATPESISQLERAGVLDIIRVLENDIRVLEQIYLPQYIARSDHDPALVARTQALIATIREFVVGLRARLEEAASDQPTSQPDGSSSGDSLSTDAQEEPGGY